MGVEVRSRICPGTDPDADRDCGSMSQRDDPVSSMAKLKQICDRLAFAVDLPQNELAAYARGLCGAGLIPHGRDAEATPEATAWLILTVLCGPESKRAVERAQEVAQFRNYQPSMVSFSASDGWA